MKKIALLLTILLSSYAFLYSGENSQNAMNFNNSVSSSQELIITKNDRMTFKVGDGIIFIFKNKKYYFYGIEPLFKVTDDVTRKYFYQSKENYKLYNQNIDQAYNKKIMIENAQSAVNGFNNFISSSVENREKVMQVLIFNEIKRTETETINFQQENISPKKDFSMFGFWLSLPCIFYPLYYSGFTIQYMHFYGENNNQGFIIEAGYQGFMYIPLYLTFNALYAYKYKNYFIGIGAGCDVYASFIYGNSHHNEDYSGIFFPYIRLSQGFLFTPGKVKLSISLDIQYRFALVKEFFSNNNFMWSFSALLKFGIGF